MEIFKDNRDVLDKEFKIELFTKYINRVLRTDYKVEDWAFTLDPIERLFVVRIDYVGNWHSRDMYDLSFDDIDVLRAKFDIYYDGHKKDLEDRWRCYNDKTDNN